MAELPVVQITGTGLLDSQTQFRQACIDYGTTYQTVQELPFLLDTSQATVLRYMFYGCQQLVTVPPMDTSQVNRVDGMFYNCQQLVTVPPMDTSQVTNMNGMFRECMSLTQVPYMDTSQVTDASWMFYNCSSLTDGNVHLIGRHPNVSTSSMILGSGLTSEPFYDTPPGIPVTPQEPTFLDESPWVVIPTQVGVTYSTSGTPGWNSSVTVTATADEGYVITGWFTWTKEWGARPLPSNALIQEDIDMVYFGNQWAEALYKGGMVVWEFVTPKITTFSLTEMEEGQYFSQQINTNFEVVSWSAEGLPAGLSLSQSGLLSGTPTAESSGVVTITANGIGPRTAQESYMWSVVKGGPQADARLWMDFNDSSNRLKNIGTSTATVSSSGSVTYDRDHAIFPTNGRLTTQPTTSWYNGFTISMWTRDTPANSGWKTIMHRAVPSGTLTNEAYIVHNTSATTTTTFSGLKFGSTHREFSANYSLPVGVDWFHTVVVWNRTSTTTFTCTFYINGVQRGSFNGTGYPSGSSQFGSEQLWVGGNRTAGEWSGRMDDFLVWDRAISAAEVTELYNQGRSWLPSITTSSLPNFTLNEYAYFSFADDFNADSWSATGVPAGMSMSTAGVLSGTPTTISSGTIVVTATRTSTGQSATKSFSWAVIDIPPLPSMTITASGASKVSHTGWNRPNITWSRSSGTGAFTTNGSFQMPHGEGYVSISASINTATNARIVSDIRGVLAQTSSSTKTIALSTSKMIFEQGEMVHVELNGYTSNTSDRFTFQYYPY